MKLTTSILSLKNTVTTTILVMGLFSTFGVSAASQCKGLDNSACNLNAACGWINGYERKDGRVVKSFCRSKPKAKIANKIDEK